LAGQTRMQMFASLKTALNKKEVPPIESGAMAYMMAKQQYLSDAGAHWHPHLMFYLPLSDPATWGADLPASPVLSSRNPDDRMTVFMVPIGKWSDGTPDTGSHM
jgi:hypothetical protein